MQVDLDAAVGWQWFEFERRAGLAHGQFQGTVVQVGQRGGQRFGLVFKVEAALRQAKRAPAVGARKRVLALPGLFVHQGLGHGGGHGQVQPHLVLVEQHARFARDQRRVQIGLRKRGAGDHVAQKLHVGRQADDARGRQRGVQLHQCLGAGAAVHDQLGDHGVVERADRVALAHA